MYNTNTYCIGITVKMFIVDLIFVKDDVKSNLAVIWLYQWTIWNNKVSCQVLTSRGVSCACKLTP